MPEIDDRDSRLAHKDIFGSDIVMKNVDAMNRLQSSESCFTVLRKNERSDVHIPVNKLAAQMLASPVPVWFQVERLH